MHLLDICVFFQPFQAISSCIYGIYRVDLWVLLWDLIYVRVLGGSCPGFGRVMSWVRGVFRSLMGVLEGVFNGLSNY